MSARQSAAVDKALALIGKPDTDGKVRSIYQAARDARVAPSSLYRALKRQKKEIKP